MLFEHGDLESAFGEQSRGRESADAGTDHDHIMFVFICGAAIEFRRGPFVRIPFIEPRLYALADGVIWEA